MRIIKFRAIRTGTIHFFHGESLLNDSLYQGEIGLSNSHQATFEMCKKETLGQFTGLLDKNGVEIYEGDIVRCYGGTYWNGYFEHDQNCKIVFSHGGFFPVDSNDIYNDFDQIENIEVIGNIHQTPNYSHEQIQSKVL